MIDFPIVDTHVHLLDVERFKYSWAAGAPKLGRNRWELAGGLGLGSVPITWDAPQEVGIL